MRPGLCRTNPFFTLDLCPCSLMCEFHLLGSHGLKVTCTLGFLDCVFELLPIHVKVTLQGLSPGFLLFELLRNLQIIPIECLKLGASQEELVLLLWVGIVQKLSGHILRENVHRIVDLHSKRVDDVL